VLYLCIGDFVQGIGAVFSLGFIRHIPEIGEGFCILQAILLQTGDIMSAMMSVFIGIFVWTNIHYMNYSWLSPPGKKFEYTAIILSWSTAVLLVIVGWIRYAVDGHDFYTPIGFRSYCWIHEHYANDRIGLLYGWLFLAVLLLFILYAHVIYTLTRDIPVEIINSTQGPDKKKRSVAKKMLGFPLIYLIAFVPLGIERIVSIALGRSALPSLFVGIAVCIFVSNGFLNSLLYGFTRRIYQKACISKKPNGWTQSTKGEL